MIYFLVALNLNHVPFRNGALDPVRNWRLKDCVAVHRLLGTILVDHNAASSGSSFLHAMLWLLIQLNAY